MDNATLGQFQEEMTVLMEKTLNQPEFRELLDKYGFSDEVVEFPVMINLDKIKANNVNQSLLRDSSQEMVGQQIKLFGCCDDNGHICCRPKWLC